MASVSSWAARVAACRHVRQVVFTCRIRNRIRLSSPSLLMVLLYKSSKSLSLMGDGQSLFLMGDSCRPRSGSDSVLVGSGSVRGAKGASEGLGFGDGVTFISTGFSGVSAVTSGLVLAAAAGLFATGGGGDAVSGA